MGTVVTLLSGQAQVCELKNEATQVFEIDTIGGRGVAL